MRYLVDTDWLIDALAGLPIAVTTLERLSPSGIGISIISVGELYEGAYRGVNTAIGLARYREFLSPFPALSLSEPIMEHFARIRARLRQRGNLIIGPTASWLMFMHRDWAITVMHAKVIVGVAPPTAQDQDIHLWTPLQNAKRQPLNHNIWAKSSLRLLLTAQ